MIYPYFDALLSPLISDNIEQRAIDDIASLGYTASTTGLTSYLLQQLVVYRAYIICATESSTDVDDVFSQKVKQYKKELDAVVEQVKTQVLAQTGAQASRKSIAWGRG